MSNDKRKSSPPQPAADSCDESEYGADPIKSIPFDPEKARAFWRRAEESRRQMKAGLRPAMTSKAQPEKRGWQLDRLRDVLRIVFPPDGRVPRDLSHGAVRRLVAPEYEKEDWPLPSTDSVARVRGRRKT